MSIKLTVNYHISMKNSFAPFRAFILVSFSSKFHVFICGFPFHFCHFPPNFHFQMSKMRVLRLLCLVLAAINSSLAQCPWHKDVPDLQAACLCAYNLGHELSVQCDQVRNQCVPIIHRTTIATGTDAQIESMAFFILIQFFRSLSLSSFDLG